jgi:phosphoglycolate phosphatase-like HAD superfamily hydrolase
MSHKQVDFKREHDFLIAVDSDGCAFDAMEIKHKECFIPNAINAWDLQPVSKYARETAEFINLYSKWRGVNRFPAYLMMLDMLGEREEVKKRGFKVQDVSSLRQWVATAKSLSNPALEEEVKRTGDAGLKKALGWSKASNADIARIERNIQTFAFVKQSLEKAAGCADVIVVSAAQCEALDREWDEHGIAGHAKVLCGQEMGTKTHCLKIAKAKGYAANQVLMLGDALGDIEAARANEALFFPILPGDEDNSWQRFYEEGMGRFLAGQFAGAYERGLVECFENRLPSVPPWKK